MKAYENPNHEGNSEKYHTGKACVTKGCSNPAGTYWGPLWCFECNLKRINRVGQQLRDMSQVATRCLK